MVSAGGGHTVLLRSDGSVVAFGDNRDGRCNIPPLDEGMTYVQVSAGFAHTVLVRSDGSAVAIGDNRHGKCTVPPLDKRMTYTQISAGCGHTVLVRSDGSVVAFGDNRDGRCNIPPLDEGMTYVQVSAGFAHTVLVRSDGSAVALGDNRYGQCNIPTPLPGIRYIPDMACDRDLALQLEFVGEENAVTLICSTLAGEECCRLMARGVDSAWETHKRIARELNTNLLNLRLVLPDRQLLAKICRTNPEASVADVIQSNSHSF